MKAIQIGKHGLQIARGNSRGLLLPGVATDNGMNAEQFLEHVCLKAELPPTAWREEDTVLWTFEGHSIRSPLSEAIVTMSELPTALPVTAQHLAALGNYCATNLRAFVSGATPNYFAFGLPDGNVHGLALSLVMADGRETFKDPTSQDCIVGTTNCFASLHFDLAHQSNAATTGHAQAANELTSEQREAIVAFEMTLFTAQVFDAEAGHLSARHARGGPEYLSSQPFYFGINDVVSGDYKTGAAFNPTAFNLYESWRAKADGGDDDQGRTRRRCTRRDPLQFQADPDHRRQRAKR